jgi:hypothetical protein
MAKSNDPAWHQQCEQEMARHFHGLLKEQRFVIDTVTGRKPVNSFEQTLVESDQSVTVKRQMIELGSSDHALQRKLPVGLVIDVTLKNKHMVIFEKTFAHVRFQSVPPTNALIRGEEVGPLTDREVRGALASLPPPISEGRGKVPITIVLCSSAGFTRDAQLLADRLAERTLILVEPNDAGGWNVHGTPETRAVLDLIDPEGAEQKRKRIRQAVTESEFELGRSGIAAEKLATQTQLPLSRVEEEFKKMAADRRGLAAKRMDGHLVLYRETGGKPLNSGVGRMPILDKFRSIFASTNDKKVAFLAERRTQIAQQLDRVNEEVVGLEQHEQSLRDQFKANESALVRKRLTTQLVQLRKEIDRKAQLSTMLSQQANIVAAHLHTIELIQQGQGVKLPSGDELAEDAAKAEEVLAEVQADAELANELVGTTIRSGMNNEEAAMYDELMKDLSGPQPAATKQEESLKEHGDPLTTGPLSSPSKMPAQSPATPAPRRSEASPG